MTGARRERKARFPALIGAAVVAALAGAVGTCEPAGAATTGRIIVHSLSGLAMSGFDPVAYFTDGKPQMGEGAHELTYGGVVWRFRNEGNRAAFARNPDVYAPRFGGHDPVALARGIALPGHPLIWLIVDNRLYLFSKLESRTRFAAHIVHGIQAAERRWREMRRRLVP